MDTKRVFIKAKQVLLKQKAVLAILAMLILMLFFNTQFYSVYNWMNVFRSATVQGIIAMGVTMTVLCAACDLSVGGIMCLRCYYGSDDQFRYAHRGSLPLRIAGRSGCGSGQWVPGSTSEN